MPVGMAGDGIAGQPHQVLAENGMHGGSGLLGPPGERQRVRVRALELGPGPGLLLGGQLDGPPGGNLLHQVPGERGQRFPGAHPPSPLPRVLEPTALPPEGPPGGPPLPGGRSPRGGNGGGASEVPVCPAFCPAPGGCCICICCCIC